MSEYQHHYNTSHSLNVIMHLGTKFLFMEQRANEQTYCLKVSDYRQMDTCSTRGTTSGLPAFEGCGQCMRGQGMGLRYYHSLCATQHKRCFTPVFCEAIVSLRSSWSIHAEAWHSRFKKLRLYLRVPVRLCKLKINIYIYFQS